MAFAEFAAAAAASIIILSVWPRAGHARRIGQIIAALAARASGRAAQRELRVRSESQTRPLETLMTGNDIFLGVVSHELHGALTAVIGWLEVARAHTDDPATLRRALDIALRNAMQQARIIDDLLDVSRIVSGKFQIERQPLELARLARDAVDAALPAARDKHIELRCALHEPVFIQGDRERMLQVIGNLLGNAIKFNRPGGRIELTLERAQTCAHLVVSDNGAGIAADALPHVFERFWQAAAPRPMRRQGLGLGLPLVHYIVECHGGHVRAESRGLGRGARVTVELPLLACVPASVSLDTSPENEKEAILNGLGIVALDHDDDTLTWLQHLFAAHGAMTWTAHSVEEAIKLVERQHADLLISDLPITEGGDQLIRALHAQRRGKRTAALAFSNQPTEEERKRALLAGYESFVAKPCDPIVLLRAVRAVLDRSPP